MPGVPLRLAERRPVGLAHAALAAAEPGPADDRVAGLPPGDAVADRGDGADPLVAVPAAGHAPALEHHVQVAAADAAQLDRHEHVVGADLGHRHLLHLDLPGGLVHRGRHRLRNVPHGRHRS